ncbi:hypothetical protein WJX79_002812 [Trebouxia sp. C0005]
MSDDASGTVLLLRNAAAHAGQIKRELAAIIQSSGHIQSDWHPQIRGLSDPAARMLQGGLPQDYGELREPSVPDLSEVFGQGLAANARGEGVAPGEQQAPPKADDGHLDTPLPRAALSRGPQSYPIFSAMHSDDEATLSSEPSHNQIHKVKSMPLGTSQQQLQQQLQPIRTRSLASRQPLRGSPPPQQARALAPWQPWRMCQTRGGEMYAHPPARVGSAPPYPYPAHATDASTPTDRSLSPDLSAMFDKGFLKAPRAAARSPRPKRRARPAQEPLAWDRSHKGAVVRGGVGLQRGDRGVNQQDSLQELKQRFMARLQQANDGMYVNKIRRQQQAGSTAGAKRHSHSQENALMSSTRLAYMPTVEKHVPYQALLRRRPSSTSSSLPVTPLKTRPAWATSGPKPSSDTWQASESLQNSPVKAGLPQHGQAEEEEDWPDLSHLEQEGGATGVVSGRPDVFARGGASSHMGVRTTYPKGEAEMDMNVVGPVGNIAGRSKQGKMSSHFADQSFMKQSSLQQRPRQGSPSALPSRPHSRAVSSDGASPAQPWSRGTSALSLTVQQPARFHTSLHELMAQGIIHGDQNPSVPEQPAAKSRQLSHSRSSQTQQGDTTRYARQLSAPPQRRGLHAPDDWESASAKQSEGEDGRTSTAGRSMPSFASPTRSSAAKQQHQRSLHNASSRGRRGASSSALAGAASSAVGSSQAGDLPGPLMSTFRLADLTAQSFEQGSESRCDIDLPMLQPEALHQQEAQRQQAQHAQQAQPEEVQRQQQAASSSGSPVTPAAAFSFRSTMGRLRGVDAAELQSPNRSKYGRSESRDPGVRIRDHPVGSVLLEAAPAVGSMTGADLLAALNKGSEMRKAWEGGSGGSNRLVQCFVSEGQACITYGHGWLRKAVQYPLDRVHVPVTAWHPSQAVTVDTTKGAMDLEPVTEANYTIWVLGLNAALTAAQKAQSLAEVPVAQMLWHPDLFVMSN